MIETGYSEAAVEVLNVVQCIRLQDMKKIPQSFIEFLQTISAKDYKVNFDKETKIENLNLQEKSKELLGFIYITWLCDKDEFTKWKNEIQKEKIQKEKIQKNDIITEKYNPNTLFEKRNKTQILEKGKTSEQVEKLEMILHKDKNIIQKIFDKIKECFK